MVGDRFAGSMKGLVLLSGPKGFAARFVPEPEPPNGELLDFDLSLPAEHGIFDHPGCIICRPTVTGQTFTKQSSVFFAGGAIFRSRR